jgi:hypothetical protein
MYCGHSGWLRYRQRKYNISVSLKRALGKETIAVIELYDVIERDYVCVYMQ